MMNVKKVLQWLVVLWFIWIHVGKGESDDDAAIRHVTSLGLVLESEGYLLPNDNPELYSVMVSIPNPNAGMNKCAMGCGNDYTDFRNLAYHGVENCHVMGYSGTVASQDVIKVVDLKGDAWGECVLACVKLSTCQSVIMVSTQSGVQCQLRKTMTSEDERIADSGAKELSLSEECLNKSGTSREKLCNDFLEQDPIGKLLYEENSRYIESVWKKLGELVDVKESGSGRNRRNIAAIVSTLGLGALGFTIIDSLRVNNHIKELQNEFLEFEGRQVEFDKEQVEVNHKFITIVKAMNKQLLVEHQLEECHRSTTAFNMLNNRRIADWAGILNGIYDGAIRSKFGPLSPQLFGKEMVVQMISNISSLKDSVYSDDYKLFYKFSKCYVSDVIHTPEKFTFHVVLSIPRLETKELLSVYRVRQTGVIYNNTCVRLDIPELVTLLDDTWYDVTECEGMEELCTRHFNKTLLKPVTCLQYSKQCKMLPDSCDTAVVQTEAGLLVKTTEPVEAITKHDGTRVTLSCNNVSTLYIDYSNYSDVIINDKRIRAPDEPIISMEIELSDAARWIKDLTETANDLRRLNISAIEEDVRSQDQTITKMMKSHVTRFWWVMFPVVFFLGIAFCEGVRKDGWIRKGCTFCCKKICHSKGTYTIPEEQCTAVRMVELGRRQSVQRSHSLKG